MQFLTSYKVFSRVFSYRQLTLKSNIEFSTLKILRKTWTDNMGNVSVGIENGIINGGGELITHFNFSYFSKFKFKFLASGRFILFDI